MGAELRGGSDKHPKVMIRDLIRNVASYLITKIVISLFNMTKLIFKKKKKKFLIFAQ